MDPYVECKVGEKTLYTEVLEEAGQYPKWNQRLQFKLDQLPDKITIKVHDKDVTSDDLVGEAAMSPHLDDILRPTGKSQNHSLTLVYKNKKAGTLTLGTRFIVI
jgi:Ca2+-dependent lipid-binding protein